MVTQFHLWNRFPVTRQAALARLAGEAADHQLYCSCSAQKYPLLCDSYSHERVNLSRKVIPSMFNVHKHMFVFLFFIDTKVLPVVLASSLKHVDFEHKHEI